jgi:hypothetical protein
METVPHHLVGDFSIGDVHTIAATAAITQFGCPEYGLVRYAVGNDYGSAFNMLISYLLHRNITF